MTPTGAHIRDTAPLISLLSPELITSSSCLYYRDKSILLYTLNFCNVFIGCSQTECLNFLLHPCWQMSGFLSNKGRNLICKKQSANSKIGSGFLPQRSLVFLSVTVRIGQNLLPLDSQEVIGSNPDRDSGLNIKGCLLASGN